MLEVADVPYPETPTPGNLVREDASENGTDDRCDTEHT